MTGIVASLQQAGFRIEMDDFGSGYSSLNTLKDIQVDVLKLDMKFMENARDPERSLTILHSIADMSHALKLPVIVEGVETRSQVDMLAGIGWHNIQGYYYARPMPFESYLSILKEKAVPEA
jgi:EAL domain-containing protein (putative c-di-GMP-specific phosphodiesterase class I)